MDRVLDSTTHIETNAFSPEQTITGTPESGARPLTALAEVHIGVWEMTPGAATDVESDEVFVVLSGRATVSFDDGDRIELTPGSVVRLRQGDHTTWTVHETLRKLYVV